MLKNRKKIKAYKLLEQFQIISLVVILIVIMQGCTVEYGADATSEPTFLVNGKPVSEEEYKREANKCTQDRCHARLTARTRPGRSGEIKDGEDAEYTEHALIIRDSSDASGTGLNEEPAILTRQQVLLLLVDAHQQVNDTILAAVLDGGGEDIVPEAPVFVLEANCIG